MELHPGCKICKQKNVAKHDIIDEESGVTIVRKGDFVINCDGIPADPEQHLINITQRSVIDAIGGEQILRRIARMQDPVLWAQDNIVVPDLETKKRRPWVPQGATQDNIDKYNLPAESAYYQEIMSKCTARRQLYRIGRRSGKTWTLIMKVLHKMFTNEKYRILVITPNIAQLDVIFSTAREFIQMSPTLNSPNVRFVRTPQRYLELPNGSFMRGFVSGNESIRGQAADMVVIDEADYLTTDDLSAITAILSEHKDTVLAVSSTPSGAREQFWKWDNDPKFKSFHFPSMCRPLWDDGMMIEQKKENPGVKFIHEILAEYGEISEGVFQHEHIDISVEKGQYMYSDKKYISGWIYMMGVDWNPVNGTEIYVVGVDPSKQTPEYETVAAGQVFREGNTQIQAVQEIIRMNRLWNPVGIYVDRGAGSVQAELLNEFGRQAAPNTADKRLEEIVQVIDFGSKIEVRHPSTGAVQKVYAKPAIVENAIRMFEALQVTVSKYDTQLIRELRGYIIDKIGINSRPTYGMISDDISDHKLDAFLLALFGFTMKFSKFGQPDIVPIVRFAQNVAQVTPDAAKAQSRSVMNVWEKGNLLNEQRIEEDREKGLLKRDEIRYSEQTSAHTISLPSGMPWSSQRSNLGMRQNSRTPIRRSRIK